MSVDKFSPISPYNPTNSAQNKGRGDVLRRLPGGVFFWMVQPPAGAVSAGLAAGWLSAGASLAAGLALARAASLASRTL